MCGLKAAQLSCAAPEESETGGLQEKGLIISFHLTSLVIFWRAGEDPLAAVYPPPIKERNWSFAEEKSCPLTFVPSPIRLGRI